MNWQNTRAYQLASAEGATQIGVLILVYDAIAADLIRAGHAVAQNNIEERCSRSKHALLLIGHLENWVHEFEDAQLSTSLLSFYTMLRSRILKLQAAPDASAFSDLASIVSETRATWQTKEQQLVMSASKVTASPSAHSSARLSFHA